MAASVRTSWLQVPMKSVPLGRVAGPAHNQGIQVGVVPTHFPDMSQVNGAESERVTSWWPGQQVASATSPAL